MVPEDRRGNINEDNQRKRGKWLEEDLSEIWLSLLTRLSELESSYPIDGESIPPKKIFYEHQRYLMTILFMEWCGVRRELVAMQSTENLSMKDEQFIYKPPPEKITHNNGREFPVPKGKRRLFE